MQNFPLVSVVILNYNGLEYLRNVIKECLDSVLNSSYPNLEIIFVDNGSTDGSADYVVKNYPKIKVIRNERNLGFSEGFNTGIRESKGKYIALLSNDMTVDPNWLNPIIEIMEKDETVGLAGFKRLVLGTKNVIDGIGGNLYLCGRVKPIGRGEIDKKQYDAQNGNLDYIGGAMVLRREMLKKVGLFDPNLFIYSEDIDLCFRTRKNGYKVIYVPTAIIYHKGEGTLQKINDQQGYLEYMSNRSRIWCAIKHFTIMRLLSTIVIDMVWFTITSTQGKKSLLKAYLWNLKNISSALKMRLLYGPSPCNYKHPILPFKFKDWFKKILNRSLARRRAVLVS